MTSIGTHPGAGAEQRFATPNVVRKALLATGVVSSLLYGAIDLIAGLRYDGYSFYSQTISELAAVGAPKPSFLAPLFLTYVALMVAFGVGVLMEGVRNNKRLATVGALLLLYMLVGSGTGIFPIHVRGTAQFSDELPHIVSGLAAITVMFVAMSVGANALGRRFRRFTWTMVATLLWFTALTVPFGIDLARGEPTPGMGVAERIAYYAMLTWVAVLSVALLRRMKSVDEGGAI